MKNGSETQVLLDAIRRIVQTLHTSSREVEKRLGISAAQLFVLHKLREAGELSINELAERTFTHQSSISVVVAKLHDRKLVVRYTSPKDARRIQIALSAAGKTLLRKAPDAAQDLFINAFQILPPKKQKQLAGLLAEFTIKGKLGSELPPMLFEHEKEKRKHNA
jgi:DNA-binding MarR family transcriptional regulator